MEENIENKVVRKFLIILFLFCSEILLLFSGIVFAMIFSKTLIIDKPWVYLVLILVFFVGVLMRFFSEEFKSYKLSN